MDTCALHPYERQSCVMACADISPMASHTSKAGSKACVTPPKPRPLSFPPPGPPSLPLCVHPPRPRCLSGPTRHHLCFHPSPSPPWSSGPCVEKKQRVGRDVGNRQ